MVIYYLMHRRRVNSFSKYNRIYSSKSIGFFKKKKKIKEIISLYKHLPGFKDYPNDFITIAYHIKAKSIYKIFFLEHEYYQESLNCDILTRIGTFKTYEEANNKIKKILCNKNDVLSTYPDGFTISEYPINYTDWKYGFDEQ